MKQSTSSSNSDSLSSSFNDDEIEVSQILVNLPILIPKWESFNRFSYTWTWGFKRRRSALDSTPSPPPNPNLTPSSSSPSTSPSPSPSPSLQRTLQDECETETRPKVKVEASSPATPLLFSPSESDDKSKHSQRKSSKRKTREDWLEIVDELTRRRDLLRGEIETVNCYHNKLRAINSELKAKKQELCLRIEKERKPNLGISKSLNFGTELGQPTTNQGHSQTPFITHQQPSIVDQTAHGSLLFEKVQYSNTLIPPLCGSGLGMVNHMGPLGIPDLNVSAEETYYGSESSQSFDLNSSPAENRAKAAEARKRRMIRIKEMKNSCAAIKPPRFT